MYGYLMLMLLLYAASSKGNVPTCKVERTKAGGKDYIVYAALGDSISKGIGATIFCGFAYRLYNFFKECFCKVYFKNAAKPGLTTSGLLRQLKRDDELRCLLEKSDVVTITIGGNHLLNSAVDNYTRIRQKWALLGVRAFRKTWPLILRELRTIIGCQGQIYVANLYNPYKCCDPNYYIADKYIGEINSIMAQPNLIEEYNYVVVDIYSHFESYPEKTWTFFNNCFYRDPHPNYEGHKQIARLFRKVW
jgi:lysophospholipase L1-like esterase